MSRPEMMELKGAIKNLKRDAEIRLTLDVEAQQSFEFLSDQVNGLRRAFSTLSDVLIEEVDLMRSDSSAARSDLEENVAWLMKTCRATRAELTLLRTQFEATRQDLSSRVEAIEDRLDGMGQDATLLAQEVANGRASQHLLQLELVELRSALDREARERRDGQAAHQARLADLTSGFEAHSSQTQETLGALDEDLGTLRQYAAGHIGAHAGGQVELRQQLQQVGEAVEEHRRQARAQQQQLDGVSKAAVLRSQQLQERLDSVAKQHSQARASLDDALKSVSADVHLLQTHVRQVEAGSSQAQAEVRRQAAHAEAETRRQCDALGRAIHSLADTLNLTSPLIPTSPRRERRAAQ